MTAVKDILQTGPQPRGNVATHRIRLTLSNLMESPPANRPARRTWALPVAVLIACCLLGFAGRWLFVKWIVSSTSTTINRARKALATEQPQSARAELTWLLWAKPDQPEALFLLGSALRAEGRFDEALLHFDRVPPSAKVHQEASSAAAMMCLADSRLDVAEARMVQHLQQYPDSPEIRDELRWLYFNQLRPRDVESFLEQELLRDPDEFSLAADLLSSEFRKQMPREGIAYLRAADERHPHQAAVKTALGYCLWQIGQEADARAMLQSALELQPDDVRIRQMVADFLLEQGGQPAQVRELLEPTPTTDQGWFLLSRWSEQQGDVTAAAEQMQAALRLRPGELMYVQRWGELLRRLRRNSEADQALKDANRLETVQTELSELVLSRQHEQPTVELCKRLAKLNHDRQREVQARTWERAAQFLTENPNRRPATPAGRPYPAGRGPM